ncbi:MAG TPA: hypothetical protein VF572_01790 [Candidatus Saccharimonadales bacterium]|jgi:hypothetical protein
MKRYYQAPESDPDDELPHSHRSIKSRGGLFYDASSNASPDEIIINGLRLAAEELQGKARITKHRKNNAEIDATAANDFDETIDELALTVLSLAEQLNLEPSNILMADNPIHQHALRRINGETDTIHPDEFDIEKWLSG